MSQTMITQLPDWDAAAVSRPVDVGQIEQECSIGEVDLDLDETTKETGP